MHDRLSSLRALPGQRPGVPLLAVALVLTAATGAGAVSMRTTGQTAARATAPAPAAAASGADLALPAVPPPAAPPVHIDRAAAVSAAVTRVPRPHKLIEASVLLTSPRPLSHRTVRALRHVDGVTRTQVLSAGHARIDHHKAFLLGVNPATFRPWTPKPTAHSQALWQSIARGELTASFDMGRDARLPAPGATIPVAKQHRMPLRLGALASVGMAGVDAVVAAPQARRLGLRPRTGVVVSAPHADALAVRRALADAAGPHAHASLLREVVVVRDAGEFLTRAQISTMLKAAASRVGKPYVWGATGPDSFDCSGLVQWSFAQAGIRMPRVSQQQWFAGPHVDYADALPGDLLFWHYDPSDRTNIDHVAIYAGNGMMLVAPHTGAFVEYVPVPLSNLAGVVRVDPAIAAQVG